PDHSVERSAISWTAGSVTPPWPWPRLVLISCGKARSGSVPAAISVTRNKTLRGTLSDLTKTALDGRAARPFHLRDFQSRSFQSRSWVEAAALRSARAGLAARARPAVPSARPRAGEALLPVAAP